VAGRVWGRTIRRQILVYLPRSGWRTRVQTPRGGRDQAKRDHWKVGCTGSAAEMTLSRPDRDRRPAAGRVDTVMDPRKLGEWGDDHRSVKVRSAKPL